VIDHDALRRVGVLLREGREEAPVEVDVDELPALRRDAVDRARDRRIAREHTVERLEDGIVARPREHLVQTLVRPALAHRLVLRAHSREVAPRRVDRRGARDLPFDATSRHEQVEDLVERVRAQVVDHRLNVSAAAALVAEHADLPASAGGEGPALASVAGRETDPIKITEDPPNGRLAHPMA